ncbi:MAG: aminotransferase class III-fold pyridoxal phosphate-dependent enzyme [Methylococcales bacterium]
MFEPYALFGITLLIAVFLLHKIRIRLRLSRAKHPSLRGHSKWSRRIARWIPFFEYDEQKFFGSDGAPESVMKNRRNGFERLGSSLQEKSPDSIAFSESLEAGISDVCFTNAYRVPFPFRNLVREHLKVGQVAVETSGVKIKDLDGVWRYDLSGSYGVNVFGYDFYKACLEQGFAKAQKLGPVLGPYHPVIRENVEKLKAISGLDEVSFHMSGTEAVMQAVRLARYHTNRSHLLRLCGAYHGWWDGVQPGIGNQRRADDCYTLKDLSEHTLKVLETRNDIACVLINPLQALHPNSDAASDGALICSDRSTHYDRDTYSRWLQKIREICTRRAIVLIFDEVFTGFRLAYRGAQEYFKVQADLVTYGKTLGGGLPVGVLCGKHALMKRFKDEQPVNISFARGTFNSHPYVMATMHEFLKQIEKPEYQELYLNPDELWDRRVARLNQRLEASELPIRIANLVSVWTLLYTQPSRYNWMFQYYLRDHGLVLSWIGSGRLIMSHNYSDDDYEQVMNCIVAAAEAMKKDGWWWTGPHLTNRWIKWEMLKSMLSARFPLIEKVRFRNLVLADRQNSFGEVKNP